MRLVPVKYLKENSCIAINIVDNDGRFMLKEGQKITAHGINILKKLGVSYVYITDEYCFNHTSTKSTQIEHIYEHIIKLKSIAYRVIDGTSNSEDLLTATNIASDIVDDMLLLPNDFKISYEPNKLVVNCVIEQTIYVAMMATALGIKMQLSKPQLVNLCLSALLKDIALLSPKINSDNAVSYKTHPAVAYSYLKSTYNLDEEILLGILHHHEYVNGCGYPSGLKGDQICRFARIISLVDCFYTLKSNHELLDNQETLFEAKMKKILTQFDLEMINYFIHYANVFTLDTLVRLTNNDLAVIYQNSSLNPFKPVIKIIQSSKYQEGEIINLMETPHLVIKNIEYYVEELKSDTKIVG